MVHPMTTHTHNRGAHVARGHDPLARRLRQWLIVLIVCDLGLIVLRAASYPAFFAMPGALGYLIEPTAALSTYAIGICLLPYLIARTPAASAAVRIGAIAGLVGGAIAVASTALESLWMLPQRVVSVATGIAMLALFLTFGVAGFVGARRTDSLRFGLGAAVWSAVVAILIVVTFGFFLINTALPRLAQNETGDPDYLRSGWTDGRAFAIANTYDAGFTHLVEAPVIAAILGTAGSGAGRIASRRARLHPRTPGDIV